jgi:geranylgeranyl pyrophosphate synthase
LLALLHQNANRAAQAAPSLVANKVERVRRLFTKAQVFDKAEKLVEKFKAKAEAVADQVEPTELRELLYFLVDTVLDRQPPPAPEPTALPLVQLSL